MEATRKLFQQAVGHYREMSRSQRLAIVVPSVAVLSVFVAVMANSSGTSLVPLFEGRELSFDELKSAESTLKSAGIDSFERQGRRLFVPETQEQQCQRIFADSNLMATDSRSERAELLAKFGGPFSRPQQQDEAREIALQNELRRIIRSIAGIKDATVIWARARDRRIGRSDQSVTATVNVLPETGFSPPPSLVRSLRLAVANMVPDLDSSKIVIFNQATGETYSEDNDEVSNVGVPRTITKSPQPPLATSATSQVNVTDEWANPLDTDQPAAVVEMKESADTAESVIVARLLKWMSAIAVVVVCVFGLRRRRDAAIRRAPNEFVLDENDPIALPLDSIVSSEDTEAIGSINELMTGLEADRVEISSEVQEHLDQTNGTPPESIAFHFLRRTSKERLLNLIRNERPQTIAVILSHLPPDLSTELLEQLPAEDESDVLERMQQIDRVAPEAISAIRLSLKDQLDRTALAHAKRDCSERLIGLSAPIGTIGAQNNQPLVAQVDLSHGNSASSDTNYPVESANWRSGNSLEDVGFPAEGAPLRKPRFGEILGLDDHAMRELVRSVDRQQWIYALSGADSAIKQRVFEQMPVQESELLKIDLQQLGPVRLSDVDAMQKEVTDRMCDLVEIN